MRTRSFASCAFAQFAFSIPKIDAKLPHKIFFVNIEKIVNNGGLIVIYRIMQGGLALNVLHSEVGAAINQLLDEDHTFKLASYVKA